MCGEIRRIDQMNRGDIDRFIVSRWYTLQMIVRGECVDIGNADGWTVRENGEIIGMITYRITGHEMEILSLDSIREKHGIGMALLQKAVAAAEELGLRRIMLITTNDNLDALRFYQKRGFDLVKIYRNAMDTSRKLKPEIPQVGQNGIPLKHEIELEKLLFTEG